MKNTSLSMVEVQTKDISGIAYDMAFGSTEIDIEQTARMVKEFSVDGYLYNRLPLVVGCKDHAADTCLIFTFSQFKIFQKEVAKSFKMYKEALRGLHAAVRLVSA